MSSLAFRIITVRTTADLDVAKGLFLAYAASLDVDLAYQDFAAEMAVMPGKYAPPAGELLLARDERGSAIGCGGLRPLNAPLCCEMKRLYVCPQWRGTGVGKGLIEALLERARQIGYREIRLDTLPSMAAARALYRKSGFEITEPYYDTPVAGTLFMRRRLA
jgi:GNAT superfamily N-acetyltransferase